MDIIVLENEPSSYRGGQELSLFSICKSLSNRGHRIYLLYTQAGNLLEPYQQFCENTIPIQQFKLQRKNFVPDLMRFCQDILKIPVSKNAIVYCNQYQDSFFGYGLALSKQIPLVCHLRLPPPKSAGLQATIGLTGATRLIAVSQQTRSDWIEAGWQAKKIEVVYNGIDPHDFGIHPDRQSVRANWHLSLTDKVIAYVGRLDKVKGIETLLHAFALIANDQPECKLLIAGKPLLQNQDYQDFLERLTSKLGIEHQVLFLGHINNPVAVYQASDLVVIPSLWSEPFGRVLLEAMACGTPVVASQIGGMPEVLQGEFASGLFPAGSVPDLAQILQARWNWRSTDPTLGQRCRQFVLDNFHLNQTVDGVEAVLQRTQPRN